MIPDKFRELLLQRQVELLSVSEIGIQSADTVELDQSKVGRLSRMDALQTQAMSIETNRRRNIELQRIESALQRLDSEEYGFCVSCGEEISSGRLQSDPATPVCINCAK